MAAAIRTVEAVAAEQWGAVGAVAAGAVGTASAVGAAAAAAAAAAHSEAAAAVPCEGVGSEGAGISRGMVPWEGEFSRVVRVVPWKGGLRAVPW